MKLKKLLEKVEKFLSADRDTQAVERKSVRELLKKLKDKERSLRKQLDDSRDSEERDSLKTRLEVVHAQRKKGVERIRALRKKKKAD
jgi:FtsZ-binding cell division protein ZapB